MPTNFTISMPTLEFDTKIIQDAFSNIFGSSNEAFTDPAFVDGWEWQTFWSCKDTGAVFWKCQNRTNAAYKGQIAFDDVRVNAGCRERPSLVFDSDGTSPVALLNGLSPDPYGVDKKQGNAAS
eukprot:COSAG02_NODE_21967_length_768_cov_0.886398_1_plen_122_part_01